MLFSFVACDCSIGAIFESLIEAPLLDFDPDLCPALPLSLLWFRRCECKPTCDYARVLAPKPDLYLICSHKVESRILHINNIVDDLIDLKL